MKNVLEIFKLKIMFIFIVLIKMTTPSKLTSFEEKNNNPLKVLTWYFTNYNLSKKYFVNVHVGTTE